jgi:prepilin-type N-terminal cleavage/methylation domain-containing protein/prepilin-type processing-associated H-X9-DG protein
VHRAGFTLIELLVVIGIISLLVSILLPSLQTAKEMAKRIKCAGNMRAICTGLVMFDTDQGVLPQRFNPVDPNSNWGYDDDLINGGHAERDMFVCPSHDRVAYDRDFKSQPSYGFNWYYDNTSMDRVGMDKVILGEAWGDRDMGCHRVDVADWDREPYKMAVERHRGKANYGFLDGHVKYASFEEISGTDPNFYHQRWGTDQGRHNLLSYWPR